MDHPAPGLVQCRRVKSNLCEGDFKRAAHVRRRADKKFGLLAADGRAFFGHGTFHQQDAERHRERHDGE